MDSKKGKVIQLKTPQYQLMVLDGLGKLTKWDYVIAFTRNDQIDFSQAGYKTTDEDVRKFYPPEQLELVGII